MQKRMMETMPRQYRRSSRQGRKGELEASPRTYFESSPTRSLRATRRLRDGSTVRPVHPASILEERTVKKAIPSKQTNQEARLTLPVQLTFDGAARWMAGNARLQAHKIESM